MKSLILASLFVPALAIAQPSAEPTYAVIAPAPMPAPAQPKAEKADSINFSPLGLLFGAYSLGYEHLWNGEHGLILEGTFAHQTGTDTSSSSVGGAVGYRWHWRGQQNSGFLGITAAQGFGSADAAIFDSDNKMQKFKLDVAATSLTANIGKRWMLGDAFNITLRFGLGWAHYAVHAQTTDMDAKAAEKKVNDLLALFPVGIDGELSVGYVF
jgi:hypothetical protein